MMADIKMQLHQAQEAARLLMRSVSSLSWITLMSCGSALSNIKSALNENELKKMVDLWQSISRELGRDGPDCKVLVSSLMECIIRSSISTESVPRHADQFMADADYNGMLGCDLMSLIA